MICCYNLQLRVPSSVCYPPCERRPCACQRGTPAAAAPRCAQLTSAPTGSSWRSDSPCLAACTAATLPALSGVGRSRGRTRGRTRGRSRGRSRGRTRGRSRGRSRRRSRRRSRGRSGGRLWTCGRRRRAAKTPPRPGHQSHSTSAQLPGG